MQRTTTRARFASSKPDPADDDREKLTQLAVELDQYWDLLRQRRARREYGEDPEQAAARDAGTVERYTG